MGLFDRARSLLPSLLPSFAPPLDVQEVPIDAQTTPRPAAHTRARARDIDPNNLAGPSRGGGYRESTSAMVNMVSGQGTSRDASAYNTWASPRTLSQAERRGMGRNGLVQQALGKLPNTATREGWEVEITDPAIEDRQAITDQISAYERRLGLPQKVNRALIRGRNHSSAMVILGIADGQDFSEPVDVENIATIRWAVTIDSRYFRPYKLAPTTSEEYGTVSQFQITDINGVLEDGLRYGCDSISYTTEEWEAIFQKESNGGQLIVHASRVLYFPTPDYYSLLDSLQDSLGAYFETMGGIRTAARESSLIKYKLSALKRKMWSANSQLAQEHMGLVQRAKSVFNAFVVDADEDVSLLNRSLGGVADLANPVMAWVAAAIGIPVTVFWGVSPGGFGKGEAERETFHEDAGAYQDNTLTPPLTKAQGYILAAKDGPQLPFDTQREIKYNDLTPPDESEQADLRGKAIDDLVKLLDNGTITRVEAREALAVLNDPFFALELDKEFKETPAPAQVGIFTGSIVLMQALAEGNLSEGQARALLLALDPVHFTPSNIMEIIPSAPVPEAPPAAPTSEDPDTATGSEPPPSADPNASDPLAEEESTPADDEPSEIDILWSEAEPPADAEPAKELAEHPKLKGTVTAGQITSMRTHGAVTGYKKPGFNKQPVYSLEEVRHALMKRQGLAPEAEEEAQDPAAEAAKDIAPGSLCVTLPLPKELARWFPYKEEDGSPPHVTLSYAKKVPPAQIEAATAAVRGVLEEASPIAVRTTGAPVEYFDTPKGRVAYAHTEIARSQELFEALAAALDELGIKVERHGPVYVPHTTLAYLDEGELYSGTLPPDTSWIAESAHVYRGGDLVTEIQLVKI